MITIDEQAYDTWKLASPDDGYNDEPETKQCEHCGKEFPIDEMHQDPEDEDVYFCDEHFVLADCDDEIKQDDKHLNK